MALLFARTSCPQRPILECTERRFLDKWNTDAVTPLTVFNRSNPLSTEIINVKRCPKQVRVKRFSSVPIPLRGIRYASLLMRPYVVRGPPKKRLEFVSFPSSYAFFRPPKIRPFLVRDPRKSSATPVVQSTVSNATRFVHTVLNDK